MTALDFCTHSPESQYGKALALHRLPAFANLADDDLLTIAQAATYFTLPPGLRWTCGGKVLQKVFFALENPPRTPDGEPCPIIGLRCILDGMEFPFDLTIPAGEECHLIGFSKGPWFTITGQCPSILMELLPTLPQVP